MATHQSHEEAIKTVVRGLGLLAVVTVLEVAIALVGNGHIIDGFELPKFIMYPIMIGLSLYKAYFIIYEFMHMGYEVPGLRMSVLLPTGLLLWAIIAFFQEGDSWGKRRANIQERNQMTQENRTLQPENESVFQEAEPVRDR